MELKTQWISNGAQMELKWKSNGAGGSFRMILGERERDMLVSMICIIHIYIYSIISLYYNIFTSHFIHSSHTIHSSHVIHS